MRRTVHSDRSSSEEFASVSDQIRIAELHSSQRKGLDLGRCSRDTTSSFGSGITTMVGSLIETLHDRNCGCSGFPIRVERSMLGSDTLLLSNPNMAAHKVGHLNFLLQSSRFALD
ncbi:DNA replication ATP-dependent helicase dna2 [Pseudozyma hubeiensis SY62]|uniref:DNA replication ATP-dependent helicase dna2 n=1 Tax=Pseudozyma hubeiensis (strain SY62) TaxID=1305764 RepID=R9PK44_PSEHS|nr:DNA replication ATP-dependent helicase dna2 [Pseudozyma hubeiensis SY62]GAC98480.1 DNA replication ATP-dependent helicase dna2 [Pseudozyma hubeiensis SY62]